MFKQQALLEESPRLRKFALRLTKNADDADDLTQSTLMRALEKSEMFEDGTNLFSWTSKIMFNLFVTTYRRKSRRESQYDPAPYIAQLTVAPTQEDSADLATVGMYIARLTPEHREVLMLVCAQGLRYEEAAEILRIPVGTVRSRLSRARADLQILMSPEPDGAAVIALSRSLPEFRAAA